jgi:hypothetical protein
VFNNPNRKYLFPSREQLRDPNWKALYWDPLDTLVRKEYTTTSTQDLNGALQFPSVVGIDNPIYATPVTRFAAAVKLPEGQYVGSILAGILQDVIHNTFGGTIAVIWNENAGRFVFTFDRDIWLPTGDEIRNASWKANKWDPYSSFQYYTGNARDFNSQLNLPPSTFTRNITTGVVDLLPYREVFLHSSLTNFHTLKANGEKDCLLRVPVDAGYGEIINFRNFGGAENAIAASDKHFRQLTWTLRDWQGNVVALEHPMSIELCFIDSDPFTM